MILNSSVTKMNGKNQETVCRFVLLVKMLSRLQGHIEMRHDQAGIWMSVELTEHCAKVSSSRRVEYLLEIAVAQVYITNGQVGQAGRSEGGCSKTRCTLKSKFLAMYM